MAARPRVPPRLRARLRRVLVAASAFVLFATGAAWGVYAEVVSGITTTDVIAGGGGPEQNILLVGVDSRTDAHGRPLSPQLLRELNAGDESGVLNTDAIMVLHLPEDGGAGVAFAIPRDAYVAIPDHGPGKINSAYPTAKARAAQELVADGDDRTQVEAESARQGRTVLIETVEDLTGLEIDHYAEVNLAGFVNLTKAIGGVEVCLNAPVADQLSGARFRAGNQTIVGGAALAFVRQRHGLPEGDLSRVRRQQVFLAAVADKVLSAGTLRDPATLARLVEVAQQSVVIDEGWDVLEFAAQAADIAAGSLEFVTVPTQGAETNSSGDVLVVDSYEIRRFVEQRISALEAAAEVAVQASTTDGGAAAREGAAPVAVDVRNASGITGAAARVADRMRALGFGEGAVGNMAPTQGSVVRHGEADDAAARSVAQELGGLALARDAAVPAGHVVVVLGRDFDQSVLAAALPPPRPRPADSPNTEISAATVPCID